MAETRRINLALQGGGAHGAFTWGVIDRLLEEPDLDIAGISGTSAGALNGAALKAGLIAGGRQAARDNLDWLWQRMGAVSDLRMSEWMQGIAPRHFARAIELSPAYVVGEAVSRLTSPYAYGPFYANPLRPVVEAFDFGKVCATQGPAFFICATRVRSGKIRVFSGDAITTDSILASACLPTIFRAVEIADPETGETEPYWDGGYTGNPALFPLFRPDLPSDIVIVNINPLERSDLPVTPQQIHNRINEISFNASLLRELRAISFVQRLLDERAVPADRMRRLFVHMIADDALMNELSVATKMVPVAPVLTRLKEAGRSAASAFLDTHFDAIGQRSSADLPAMFG